MNTDSPLQQARRRIADLEHTLSQARDEIARLEGEVTVCPWLTIYWSVTGATVSAISRGNLHYLAQFGYADDAFQSGQKQWTDIIAAADLPQVATDTMRHVQERDEQFTRVYRIHTGTGNVRWVEEHTAAVKDSHGNITGYLACVLDITKRRLEEEQRFTILESLPVGVWTIDRQGHVTHGNPAAHAIWNAPEFSDELIGYKGWWADTGKPLAMSDWASYRAVTTGATILNEEVEIETFDGQRKFILNSAIPLRDEVHHIVGAIVVNQDITNRKRIEHEREKLLTEVNRRAAELDATIAAMADGVVIYDNHLTILRMNAGAERILGFTSELAARPLAERLKAVHFRTTEGTPVSLPKFPVVRAVAGETVRNVIYSLTRQDGRELWVSLSAAPIRITDAVIGAVGTFTDITEFHALQQRQTELLHIVSHDLRLPLSVIQGYAQLLAGIITARQLDGELSAGLSAIVRSVQRMNLMIQDLVDVARLEGKQLMLQCEPVAFDHFLPELLQRVAEILPISRVQVHLAPELPPVWADYARLERVLLNLLSNALKYSAPDTPVEVRAIRQDDEVVITVADQGCGIAAEDLPHIFERFYRVKGERKAEAVGLGLYITKMLTEAHGGRIWARSTVGKGSTFFVALPVARGDLLP